MPFDFNFTMPSGSGNFSDPSLPNGTNRGSLSGSIVAVTPDVLTGPCAVFLEAPDPDALATLPADVGNYQQNFHRYTYHWYIEGAPLEAFSAPQNMLPEWNNPNQSWGKRACFVLPHRAALYRIWLIASDGNQDYQLSSITFQTVSADSAYPTTQTICFSSAANFTDAPSGAQQFSTLSALESAIQAATLPTRVLFRRGETTLDVDIITRSGSASTTGRCEHLGAFGTGTKPVLRPKEFDTGDMWIWRSNSPETQVTIEDIKVEGWWNPDTETGSLGGGSPFYWRDRNTSAVILMSGVELTDYDGQQLSANNAVCDVLVHNCIFRRWRDYGVFCDWNILGKFGFIGSRFAQSPDALNGGQKVGLRNNHGPIRITRCRWLVGDVMDMFSNDGWSGNFDTQPCLRVGTHQTSNTDIFLHWGRSVMENGYQIINLEGENTSAVDNPGNFVFDRLLLISSARHLGQAVSVHKGGATFRNGLSYMPNVTAYAGAANDFFDFTANNPATSPDDNNDSPVRVYNWTAVSLQSAANENNGPLDLIGGFGSFTDTTDDNNVLHIPNGSVPVTGFAPIDVLTALAGVTPRHKGVQFNYELINDTMSTVANGATISIPYSQVLIRDAQGDGSGAATDQAYWQAIEGTDTQHAIAIGSASSQSQFYAEDGEFSVTFGASSVVITNTSGTSWAGPEYWLHLDRKSLIDTDLPLQTQFATPADVPTGRPQAGSSALGTASGTFQSTTDFLGEYTPVGGRDQGAWQGVAA